MPELSALDRQILATLQGDFPVCEQPYAEAAARLGIDEATLLQRLQQLLADKVLTRSARCSRSRKWVVPLCWQRWQYRRRVTTK